jgi:hypothetical protein
VPSGLRIAHPEREVVQQQRPARRPRARPVGLEHHRREHLDPVHHQRPMPGEPQSAGPRVDPQPLRSLSCHERRIAIRRATPDHLQRLSDPPRDELILARRVRTLMEVDRALARLTGVVPGLLTRQHLGEAMRTIAVGGHALVALPAMLRRTVMAVEPHPRPRVLRPRAHGLGLAPALAQRRHVRREDSHRIGRLTHLSGHLQLKLPTKMRLGGQG